jgi:hypothetical protein
MCDNLQISPGMQRLFRNERNQYILLHKAGIAVSFWIGEGGVIRVGERLAGVEFKATGSRLKKEGWKCVGPGMNYSWLLTDKE